MILSKYPKENVTIGFYIIYILLAGACYELFPGDAETPNMGVLLFFLLIPIALLYALVQAFRHVNGKGNYIKCFFIHIFAWVILVAFLTNFKK